MAIHKALVLLVENNADLSWLAMRAITKRNKEHELIHFNEGESLLAYLDTKLNIVPKLIFLDIHLPKKNGLDILKLLKENKLYVNIPVIMLISPQQTTNIFEMYEAGATSYILKPLNEIKFTEALINLEYLVAIAKRKHTLFSGR